MFHRDILSKLLESTIVIRNTTGTNKYYYQIYIMIYFLFFINFAGTPPTIV